MDLRTKRAKRLRIIVAAIIVTGALLLPVIRPIRKAEALKVPECIQVVTPTVSPTPSKMAQKQTKTVKVDNRAKNIEKYLKTRKSPMAKYAKVIVAEADKNKVDPRLIVAISVIESGAGVNGCGTYNPFGIMTWVKGKRTCRRFKSYTEAIKYEAWLMGEYRKGGKVTVDQIGQRYDPNNKKWIKDVKYIISKIY